jgi:hypothetical protein
VGVSLTLGCLFQCGLPFAFLGLAAAVQGVRRMRLLRPTTRLGLDELARGPQWQPAAAIGQALGVLFLLLALCGGIPGVFLLLPLFLPLFRFASRAFLVKLAAPPPRYDEQLVASARALLLWALVLHHGLTAWLYGAAALPSFALRGGDGEAQSLLNTRLAQSDVVSRLRKVNVLIHAIPFLLLSAALLARLFRARSRGSRSSHDEESAGETTFSDAIRNGELRGLRSYRLGENAQYEGTVLQPTRVPSIPPKPAPAEDTSGDALVAAAKAAADAAERDRTVARAKERAEARRRLAAVAAGEREEEVARVAAKAAADVTLADVGAAVAEQGAVIVLPLPEEGRGKVLSLPEEAEGGGEGSVAESVVAAIVPAAVSAGEEASSRRESKKWSWAETRGSM